MHDLVLAAAPAVPVLSTADAKLYLRVTSAREDLEIADLVAAATAWLDGKDGVLGRAILEQTWTLYLDCFPACRVLSLPLPPLISVESVTYVDQNGVTQTWSSALYTVHAGERAELEPVYGGSWPSIRRQRRSIAITFKAGYGATEADCPRPLRQAVRFMVADAFMQRETSVLGISATEVKSSVTVDRLIRPFRIPRL